VPPAATTLQAQGIAATIPKPFTFEELLFVIERVVPRPAQRARR
jgi:hypothetical protein